MYVVAEANINKLHAIQINVELELACYGKHQAVWRGNYKSKQHWLPKVKSRVQIVLVSFILSKLPKLSVQSMLILHLSLKQKPCLQYRGNEPQ